MKNFAAMTANEKAWFANPAAVEEFVEICRAAQAIDPTLADEAVTAAVFQRDGAYYLHAAALGVDVVGIRAAFEPRYQAAWEVQAGN